MKLFLLILLCIFALVVKPIVGCLHFEASPSTINIGFTKQILINCTFRYTENSAITNVTQISVAKSGQGDNHEIATIKRPHLVSDSSLNSNCFAQGNFDVDDLSSLTVRVNGPVVQDAGTYVCSVKGLDNRGHFHEAEEKLSVNFVKDDLCSTDEITLEEKLSLLFFPPAVLDGSYYYLSKLIASNSSHAEDYCYQYSGYLVEVDDEDELQVVYELSKKYNMADTLIAGTDDYTEGKWVFPRTGDPVQFHKWHDKEPNNAGGDEDCRLLDFLRGDEINDVKCINVFSFICEMNEAPKYISVY